MGDAGDRPPPSCLLSRIRGLSLLRPAGRDGACDESGAQLHHVTHRVPYKRLTQETGLRCDRPTPDAWSAARRSPGDPVPSHEPSDSPCTPVMRTSVVPKPGFEPGRGCPQRCLRPSRLPVPPLRPGWSVILPPEQGPGAAELARDPHGSWEATMRADPDPRGPREASIRRSDGRRRHRSRGKALAAERGPG